MSGKLQLGRAIVGANTPEDASLKCVSHDRRALAGECGAHQVHIRITGRQYD